MSRALWFAAGAGAGIWAVARARRAAEALTPEGLADRLSGLAVGARLFGEEVRTGAAAKEHDVRSRVQHRLGPGRPTLEDAEAGPTTGRATRQGRDRPPEQAREQATTQVTTTEQATQQATQQATSQATEETH